MWKISAYLSFTFVCILVLTNQLSSQPHPEMLWHEDADAIVLSDTREFHIKSNNKAEYKIHRKIRINNDRGKKYGEVVINENKFIKCTRLTGRVLDLDGNELKKLNKKDILKANISPQFILFDDSKYQRFELGMPNCPYIVEYSYEKTFSTLFFWPGWYPQTDIPVLKATYMLALRTPINYRTHSIGLDIEPTTSKEKGIQLIKWELEDIEPKIEEDWMPPENELQMALLFAPIAFQLEAVKGSLESWDRFADWYRQLTSGRYVLLPETRQQIIGMVSETMNERQKIQTLYSFLQNHTRYVAIELGLAGWQPQSAQSVFDNRYGDCKDLTTLMITMLEQVDIKAYPAHILTRDHGRLIKEFPGPQFNHCIAFIPLQSDTVWVECTADFIEAGMLPASDQDCDVLVVKKNSAELLRTPINHSDENVWGSRITGRLTSSGSLFFEGTIATTGNIGASQRNMLGDMKAEERRRKVSRLIGTYAPKINLQDYKIINLSENYSHPLRIKFSGTIDKFGATSADRIFINPNLLNRQTKDDIPEDDEREFPVHYRYVFQENDTLEMLLPERFEIEAMPDSINLETPFGIFNARCKIENGTLKYIRQFELVHNQIPVTLYDDYRAFLKMAVRSDNAKFVLRKISSF